ncbi:MAG TPA: autotransporter domain-containing protein [Allosphingosinicella sp.]|nr:autotransporter domain-containing protein [Allosphingosinicella sp.]
MRKSVAKLLCAAALAGTMGLWSAPASAQRVTRIVAFGDSYADTGNLFRLLGIAPPPVYATGRFSGGTNFVDTMSQLLAVQDDNFAIGGALAGNGNITAPGPLGFQTEVQSFLAGGGPAAFPRVSGRFGPTDLLVVSIGGNDARAYEQSLGLAPSNAQLGALVAGAPAAAQVSAAQATTGLTALVNAGARNITFLAGDVGRLPEVQGLGIAQAGSAFSGAFNAGMTTTLAGFARQGVIVNYLDLNKIADVVGSNLSAFGLQSAGACPIACVTTNPELLDKFLFYVDQLHLTSAGFAIVGRYAVRQLAAPLQLQAQAETGLQAAGAFGSTLSGRLDLGRGHAANSGLGFYVLGHASSRDYASTLTSEPFSLNTAGATAGAEYRKGGAVIGVAADYSRPKADFGTGDGNLKASDWQVGAYAGWSGLGAFVQGYAGYGWLRYRINRAAVIDTIHSRPDGKSVAAGAKAGYLAGFGGVHVGPIVALAYQRATVNAYTETGDPVLTLNVGRQKADSLLGNAGFELRGDIGAPGLAISPYVAVTAERELQGDARTVTYAETAAPTIVNSFNLPRRPRDTHGRVSAGASLALGGKLSLQVQGSTSFERSGGDDRGGFVGLKVGF